MTTLALFLVVALAVLAAAYFALSRRFGLEPVFIKTCWIPVAFTAGAYLLRIQIIERFGYAVIVVGLLIFMISLLWTAVGLVLVFAAREQGRAFGRLAGATALAAMPNLALAAVLGADQLS